MKKSVYLSGDVPAEIKKHLANDGYQLMDAQTVNRGTDLRDIDACGLALITISPPVDIATSAQLFYAAARAVPTVFLAPPGYKGDPLKPIKLASDPEISLEQMKRASGGAIVNSATEVKRLYASEWGGRLRIRGGDGRFGQVTPPAWSSTRSR